MLLKTKGIASGIHTPIVGRVTFNATDDAEILILEGELPDEIRRFKAILTNRDDIKPIDLPTVYSIPNFFHLKSGDIVVINTDGVINTQYRVDSSHNFLLFTERCNSNCLMCSQPPRDRDDTSYFFDIYSQMIPLIPKNCQEIGITGGEPTLLGERFFKLLESLQFHLPDTEVHCLTNGRSFSRANIAERLGALSFGRLMLGIPIYSDFSSLHNYIVQAENAFEQTVQGLYNLAKQNVRIELRVVLHKPSISRLGKLSKFIYKNLPFVEHVAFMALENQGYTPYNMDKLWIDPIEYGEDLAEAMTYLSDHGMNVSLYNSQLCVTPGSIWQFSRKSISDWKNVYLNECDKCSMRDECGGFFSSGVIKHSMGIKALS